MKVCKKCGTEKDSGLFYAHPKTKDKLDPFCKECRKENSTRVRNERIEHYREYDRRRANDEKRVAGRIAYKKTEQGRAVDRKSHRSYLERNPIKRSAHIMVGNAVRDGHLEKLPCEVCGATTRIHGHHDDYSKPLSVRWLCPKHHSQWHKENRSVFCGVPVDY